MKPPVITIDGPTASGKGTVAERVAARLGFHYLDSGALYRIVALAALRLGIELTDEPALVGIAKRCRIEFKSGQVLVDGVDVAADIRAEEVGNAASRIAVLQSVREALLDRQRNFRQEPGLVTDGRDMGTVVFPDANLKIFLTASVETRAERRSKQLIEKGFSVNITSLLADLRQRDARDAGRANAPLRAADDAIAVDSSQMSADQVVDSIVAAFSNVIGAA